LSIILYLLTLECTDLLVERLDLLVRVEHFAFEGFNHAHLLLEVFGQVRVVGYVAVALSLENAELVDCVCSLMIDIRDPDFGVLVCVSCGIQVHLQVPIDLVV
jgi:hypothetical protein